MPRFAASAARPALAGALLVALLVWLVDLAVLRAAVPHPLDDSWEYGVAARSVAAGAGLRTTVIPPPLWTLRDSAGTVPLLVHGPLLPIVLAPFVRVFGAGALGLLPWLAAAAATLAAVRIARLGARLWSPDAGRAAALAWTLSPLTIRAVNHDAALAVGALFFVLALDLLVRREPRPLAAGLALGLGSLVRTELPVVALLLLPLAGRRHALSFALGVLVCMAPWWMHNLRATGMPFFSLSSYLVLGYSKRWPELATLRDFDLPPRLFAAALLSSKLAIAGKALAFLPHALRRALTAPSVATGWLAALGLAATAARPERRPLAWALAAIAAVPIAVMSLTVYDERYLTPFLPLWALGAARGGEALASFLPWRARRGHGWVWAFALLLAVSLVPALVREAVDAHALAPRLAAERAALAARGAPALGPAAPRRSGVHPVAPPAMFFSDTPDFVAWTTGVPTLYLTRADYERLPPAGAARDTTRPPRGEPSATWFHDDGAGR